MLAFKCPLGVGEETMWIVIAAGTDKGLVPETDWPTRPVFCLYTPAKRWII